MNCQQGHGRPRLNVSGERRLAQLVWSHRRATVAQIVEQVNAGCDMCYVVADRSECLCWTLSTSESAYNGHACIRTGPLSNGRRWPGLMNQVPFTLCGQSVWVSYLRNKWHQDALAEEGKPAEEIWCSEQYSAGKPWLLAIMGTLLWHVLPT